MSEARNVGGEGPFRARVVLAVVIVGVVAFCGLMVLTAYAPDLRRDEAGGADVLSRSAVGFAGLERTLRALGNEVTISREPPRRGATEGKLLILTPTEAAKPLEMRKFGPVASLIVLPKWRTQPAENRDGFVTKTGLIEGEDFAKLILNPYSDGTKVARRAGVTRPVLKEIDGRLPAGATLPLDTVDRLQTISGDGWQPLLVDENGLMVAAQSKRAPVIVLADPDLLNNQGFAKLANARAGMLLIEGARAGRPIVFDTTLNGFENGGGLLRLIFEPPWVAATLCAFAAAVLAGLHALARFGPTRREGRALAFGKRALVDNSAALVRMARKDAQMAAPYAELIWRQTSRAAASERARGPERDAWLADLAQSRGLDAPAALNDEADKARNRYDLLKVARKLYAWKGEAVGGSQ